MPDVTNQFVERGDLAHLALFLWATSATGLLVWARARSIEQKIQRLCQ